jgi:methyl-accepting chemotaxis protein
MTSTNGPSNRSAVGSFLRNDHHGLAGPARKVALGIVAMIVLFGAALAVSGWRYGQALNNYAGVKQNRVQLGALVDADHVLLSRFNLALASLNRAQAVPPALAGLTARFDRDIDEIAGTESAAQLRLGAELRNEAARLYALERSHIFPDAAGPRQQRAYNAYTAIVGTMLSQLDQLKVAKEVEASGDEVAGADLASQARTVAIIAGLLGLAVAIVIGFYAVRMLNRLFAGVRSAATTLLGSAAGLRSAAQEASAATVEQSAAIAEVTAAVDELSATSSAISEYAETSSDAAGHTNEMMRAMREQVQGIADRSLDLGQSNQEIGGILKLINDISDQTNLLALNAAIEAARAGEAGRGFAVVATEVGKLAERSVSSTDSIREILDSVRDKSNQTILATEEGTKGAELVAGLMQSSMDALEQSRTAAGQQQQALEQVARTMVEIRTATQQLSAEQESRVASAEEVENLVNDLGGLLAGYGIVLDETGANGNGRR